MLIKTYFVLMLLNPNGLYQDVKAGDTINFDGWCYDKIANARLLTEIAYCNDICKAKIDDNTTKITLDCERRLKLERTDYDFLLNQQKKYVIDLEKKIDLTEKENAVLNNLNTTKNYIILVMGLVTLSGGFLLYYN